LLRQTLRKVPPPTPLHPFSHSLFLSSLSSSCALLLSPLSSSSPSLLLAPPRPWSSFPPLLAREKCDNIHGCGVFGGGTNRRVEGKQNPWKGHLKPPHQRHDTPINPMPCPVDLNVSPGVRDLKCNENGPRRDPLRGKRNCLSGREGDPPLTYFPWREGYISAGRESLTGGEKFGQRWRHAGS
jgi:hypothetical protein